jgi:hypothetical protein
MKKLSIIVLALLLAAPACAAGLPRFDVEKYCQGAADCVSMENRAKAELKDLDVEPKIMAHCANVGKTLGGSYSVVQTCIETELEAKANPMGSAAGTK